jgi:hypothetical protein
VPAASRAHGRPRGRPTGLDDQLCDGLTSAFAAGATVEQAAAATGVPARTLRLWLRRGRLAAELDGDVPERERPYRRLVEQNRTAVPRAEVAQLRAVRRRVAAGSWKAAAWYLEHVHPERYRRR